MTDAIKDQALVNGIDVVGLKQMIAEIEANPEKAQTRWQVTSRWQGGTRTDHHVDTVQIGCEKVARQFQIQIDEPCELGGTNQFANPQEFLMAATNACMMVGYSAVAAVMGVELTKLEIETAGDIDLRGFLDVDRSVPPGYERIDYNVRIAGNGTREQFEKMHEVVQRTSPNYYNMTNAIPLESKLVIE